MSICRSLSFSLFVLLDRKLVPAVRDMDMPPFAPVLMESTRAIGYSLEAAIADVIDNSIAAKAGKVRKEFLEKIEHTEPFCEFPEMIQVLIDKEKNG